MGTQFYNSKKQNLAKNLNEQIMDLPLEPLERNAALLTSKFSLVRPMADFQPMDLGDNKLVVS